MSQSKNLVEKYFELIHEVQNGTSRNQIWKCKFKNCGQQRKRSHGHGWMNLTVHLSKNHNITLGSELELSDQTTDSLPVRKQLNIKDSLVINKYQNIYSWMRFITTKKLPLTAVDDDCLRDFTKSKPICYDTLKKYMKICSKNVVSNLKRDMPEKIGIIFDGWSTGSEHYLALFSWYLDENNARQEHLLAFKPINSYLSLNNEEFAGQTAEDIHFFIYSVLSEYNLSMDDIWKDYIRKEPKLINYSYNMYILNVLIYYYKLISSFQPIKMTNWLFRILFNEVKYMIQTIFYVTKHFINRLIPIDHLHTWC